MLKTLVSIVGIALMVTGSVAASPLPGPDFVRKVERLMHWIADHSNLEVPDRQPAFLFVSVETINYVATGSRYKGAALSRRLSPPRTQESSFCRAVDTPTTSFCTSLCTSCS